MVQSAVLRAAVAAAKPEAAQKLAAVVEGPAPEDKEMISGYWANRARLARLQNRNADALTYYQAALHSRTSTPKPYQGKVHMARGRNWQVALDAARLQPVGDGLGRGDAEEAGGDENEIAKQHTADHGIAFVWRSRQRIE